MSPLKHSNNFAARMGRWSANHWKTAVFGWLAFVVASFAIGMTVGTKYLETSDANVGEAAKADKIIKEGFEVKVDEQGEMVFVQNKKLNAHDPAFRAVIADITRTIDRFPQVDLPTIVVRTSLPGASPEEMEVTVSQHVEEARDVLDAKTRRRDDGGAQPGEHLVPLGQEPGSRRQDDEDSALLARLARGDHARPDGPAVGVRPEPPDRHRGVCPRGGHRDPDAEPRLRGASVPRGGARHL